MLGWFSYSLIAQKTGLVICGSVILSPRLFFKLRFGRILLKTVLNVSASSSLFVIVLLISFNVMHFLKFLVLRFRVICSYKLCFFEHACQVTIQSSLEYLIIKVFIVPVLNYFWFLVFVETFQDRNGHFMEICFYGNSAFYIS